RSLWFVFWICIVLPPVSTCYAQIPESQSTVITLEVGKPIDCDINEMESQAYEIALRKGDLMSVLIKQPGRESLAKLLGPAGKQITEIDPVYGKEGKKVISYVAQMDGSHQLILQPPSKGAPVGPYEIELVELRAATENDLALQEARGLGTESVRLFRAGKYDDALSSAERSLEIRIKILGEDNYIVASSLNRLAACYSIKADYARVEPLYQKALKILGKILEPEHFKFGDLYNNLAAFYYNTGDYERAETFYRRGLEIREKTLGPEHTDVAASLNNLAGAFLEREMYDQAEPLYRRAIAIREKISGPEDSNLFYPLSNLADCYSLEGDYDKAEPLYQRAIAILEKKVGPYHPQFAYPLEGLARIHYLKGDYEGATTRYLRALGIREHALGANHPEVAGTLTKMAALYAAKGDVGDALKYQSRANEISEHNLALHLVIGSERQKQAYLAMQSKQTDQTISLHLQYAPGDPDACSLAVASILQLKGRALDAMSDSFAAMHRRSNPEDRVLFDRLKDTIARLAGLVISGPQKISPEDHQKQITELEERKEKLEAEISRNSTEFQAQTQPITVAAVQSAVPTEAALLEFASYRPFDPRARGNDHAYGNPRYAAYIIRHRGDVEGFELGETAEIDALISRFREALRDPLKKDVKDWARAVDEKIMQPIRAHLGDCTQLLISPDGALNLVPFAALADERGHYLVERYSFTYLTSGRDLLRLGVARVKRGAPEVIADPAFGEPELDYLARSEKRRRGPLRKRQSVTTGTDLSSVYFAPLRGTALEAHMIKGLFPDAVVLTGEQATEAALKQAAAPWILHIATHGFFLENQPGKVVDKRLSEGTNVRGLRADMKTENPLLRSGLALAGANLQKGKGGDDGILTALEASGLNLWGTRLVILSACDTGLGEVRNGDGVYGLRRALVLAGSETQVMSLWPVSDYATRDLMKSYYDGLMHGLGCGSALRQMQLKMMRRPTREHPFYWASFIQSGEWANLDGKR
ncbi:MAG: CHAT domain-containing protein, partial [Blastocatellia bacterium]|nr:CHAT domain-containing protein [Blastocatellia bacterium]